MELLTTAGVALPSKRRKIPVALGISAAVHGGMAAVLVFLPLRTAALDTPLEVSVDVLANLLAPPESPPPASPLPSVSARPLPRIDRRAPIRLRASSAGPPTPTTAAPEVASAPLGAEPEAPEVAAPAASEPTPGAPPPGSTSGGVGGKTRGGPGADQVQRATVDRYRAEVLRTRIRDVFRYPPEARELELAGRVLMTVAIHRDGRLLDAKLVGRCPHAILCADGLRTIRAAAPFPPVPAELGTSVIIEVPLTYAFE